MLLLSCGSAEQKFSEAFAAFDDKLTEDRVLRQSTSEFSDRKLSVYLVALGDLRQTCCHQRFRRMLRSAQDVIHSDCLPTCDVISVLWMILFSEDSEAVATETND